MGYYNTKLPGVILRNVLENPLWYTPYTPYQAEISQGRLESLLNFQTMVSDLTGMPYSNASLLDEATACAEAMIFCVKGSKLKNNSKFFVSNNCHPQNIAVVKTRAEPLGVEVIVGNPFSYDFKANPVTGVLFQYPDTEGQIQDYRSLTSSLKKSNIFSVFSADLLSLTLLVPPGELGADIAVGSTQRFGVPLGYGGPHAAYFAISDPKSTRKLPGRVVGVSLDSRGNKAYRLALQTREQHIKRDKATSNICTAQALPANLSAFYGIYHGPQGLRDIATKTHLLTVTLAQGLSKLGHKIKYSLYFDTISVQHSSLSASQVIEAALANEINFRYVDYTHVGISLDETTELSDVVNIWKVFNSDPSNVPDFIKNPTLISDSAKNLISQSQLARSSSYLTHAIFNKYHKEHTMLRYIYRLSSKDLSLCTSMIPLGSCTMKLNASSEMIPITWPTASLHPFVPLSQAQGYAKVVKDLEKILAKITGLDAVSLQPNSGSAGEYAGLMVIRKYLQSIGQGHRNIVLIPSSAHGTNPASAAMAGFKIEVVQCGHDGYISLDSLREKVELYKNQLAGLMVTYPSTYGVFEDTIQTVCKIIHDNGGQVYLDGANMNALVGLVSLKKIGADVCHLNLHKTFCIPHGGGGPGMGPIAVASHLVISLIFPSFC